MYFILKYMDYHEFRQQSELDLQPPSTIQIGIRQKSDESSPTKMKSRSQTLSSIKQSTSVSTANALSTDLLPQPMLPENKEVLINPDCYLGSILDYICEVATVPRNHSTDLLNVHDAPLSTPGLEFFIPKETYYVMLKDYDLDGNEVNYPLLYKNSEVYAYFMSKFNNGLPERQEPKISTTSSISNVKLKSKETIRSKETVKSKRIKSATTNKEGKTQPSTLPPIKK
ncbi:uncharacterized protein LOC123682562 isoform X2 [Harmonia axyridis]|uniref:uncharacterized protein LOC123682562 isoform X2 n=1 Tax=Harmonia axyridis TaxID=115357 RepID=UPI001E27882D|nr:uncharacterized protein LOC123682562 isoform X2 [Harmonia axyridis]